jgi:hypothetical protein
VGAVTVYPTSIAATRLRIEQYRSHLTAAGIDLRLWTFIADADVPRWFGGTAVDRAVVLLKGVARLALLPGTLRGTSVVIIQREMLPFGPPLVERLVARGRRVVWDVDDAIWEDYPGLFGRRVPGFVRKPAGKYRRLAAMAAEVWAGSAVLASWCEQWSGRVVVVPTVVSVANDGPLPPEDGHVGWIGSPSTGPFLEQILPALGGLATGPILCVGAQVTSPEGVEVDERSWSMEAEEDALSSLAVGLYPVDEQHPLADGKCALKAILYMSRGIPTVVTPTPTNAIVVRDDIDGIHARSAEEWRAAVTTLLEDVGLRRRLGAAARQRAADEYSLERWGPVVAERLAGCARVVV